MSDNAAMEMTCPKCFAEPGRACYYVNRWGNFTYLERPHKERIKAASEPSELYQVSGA